MALEEYWYALEYKPPLILSSTNFLQPSHLSIELNSYCLGMIKVVVSIDHSASNCKCRSHTGTQGKVVLQREGTIRRLNTCVIGNAMTGLYCYSR